MNNKGQVLIIFIICIPIFLILLALIVDSSVTTKEKIKLNNITKIAIKKSLENNITDEEIKKLYQENKIDTSNLVLTKQDDKITISIDYKINSIFGNIINIKNYEIKINKTGEFFEGQIIYK